MAKINDPLESTLLEGVFITTKDLEKDSSLRSIETVSTFTGDSSVELEASASRQWKSSGEREHNKNAPLLVSDPENPVDIEDPASELGRLITRSRSLPGLGQYASNHIMINQERNKRCAAPLKRLRELDSLAREHAEKMAAANQLFHSTPSELKERFNRPSRRLGENVARGNSIAEIHKDMIKDRANKNNINDRRYTHMGCASVKGSDGKLYLCQVFRG